MTSMLSGQDRGRDVSTEGVLTVASMSPPKRRRPSWIALGVLLAALAGALGAYVFSVATDTVSVVVAAHDIAPGEALGPDDVRVVEMGRTGELRAVLADQQDLILGRSSRGPIPEGTVLNTGLFVDAQAVVPSGKAVVGAAFAIGAVPTSGLRAGDKVELLRVASSRDQTAGGTSPSEAIVLGSASVWSVEGAASTESASERVWIGLLVDVPLQGLVAQAAADDMLRLALVGSG